MYVVYWRYIVYYTNLIMHNGMASLKINPSDQNTNFVTIGTYVLQVERHIFPLHALWA